MHYFSFFLLARSSINTKKIQNLGIWEKSNFWIKISGRFLLRQPVNWPCFHISQIFSGHFMNFLWKKESDSLFPWCWSCLKGACSRVLGMTRTKIHTRLTRVSKVKNFYKLTIAFVVFTHIQCGLGQSYLATLVTTQNCTKMLRE